MNGTLGRVDDRLRTPNAHVVLLSLDRETPLRSGHTLVLEHIHPIVSTTGADLPGRKWVSPE